MPELGAFSKLVYLGLPFLWIANTLLANPPIDAASKPEVASMETTVGSHASFSFIENRGQWAASTRFAGRLSNVIVLIEKNGIVLQPRGGGDGTSLRLGFENAFDSQVEGDEALPGRYHFYFGNNPSSWHTNVYSFRSIRYRCLEQEIELVLRENAGSVKYDLFVPAGADLEKLVLHLEGSGQLRVGESGSLQLETPAGQLVQLAAPSFELLPSGERRPIEARYKLLGGNRFCFEVAGRDPGLGMLIDSELIWSTYLGGIGNFDDLAAVAVDAQRNTYVTGYTDWPGFPTTPGAFDSGVSNATSIFVTKLDPTGSDLLYSAVLSGSITNGPRDSRARAIAVDSKGQATVGGLTNTSDFPTTPGAYDTVKNTNNFAGVVFRLTPTGAALVFSTFLDGPLGADCEVYALAIAQRGATVVGGRTGGGFPTTTGAFDVSYHGVGDGFVARIDPQGRSLEWSTLLGGNSVDRVRALALDDDEQVTVTGETASNDFPTTAGTFMPTHPGNSSFPYNVFLSRLDRNGTSLIWSTYFGNKVTDDYPLALALERDGGVVIGGSVLGYGFPTTPGAPQPINYDADDGFVARFDPTASNLIYSTLLVGLGRAVARGVAVDASGVVTVTGETSSQFQVTPGSFDTHWEGDFEGYIARINPMGTKFYYATFLGGNGLDTLECIALHPDRRVTVAGTTSGAFPTTHHAYSTQSAGGQVDGVMTTLDLNLQGIRPFGEGTPSCLGLVDLNATTMPRAEAARFGMYLSAAPPDSEGWLFLGQPRASPKLVHGVQLWIDLSLPYVRIPIATDSSGFLELSLPLTGVSPTTSFSAQAIILNTAQCVGTSPLAASRAVSVVVQ